MNIEEAIDFLETDSLSVTFSHQGLKYLSLRTDRGDRCISLRLAGKELEQDSEAKLLIEETITFWKGENIICPWI